MATADQRTDANDVWLPIPPGEIQGLPDGFRYLHWDSKPDYPADPARCVFYVVPYMKGAEASLRPLSRMGRVRVVQTLTAGIEHMLPGLPQMPPGAQLCNARGLHDASTAELALTLILAALRDVPGFVRSQDAGSGGRTSVPRSPTSRSSLWAMVRSAVPSKTGSRLLNVRGWCASHAPRVTLCAALCIHSPTCPPSCPQRTSSCWPLRSPTRPVAWSEAISWRG